eukprot:8314293-Ditylum_brightwellii.AAC.1
MKDFLKAGGSKAGSELDTISDDYYVDYYKSGSADAAARASSHAMPEVYHTVDASAYKSTIVFDKCMDDGFYDKDGKEDCFIGVTHGGADFISSIGKRGQ